MKRFIQIGLLGAALWFLAFTAPATAQTGSLHPAHFHSTRWPQRWGNTYAIAGTWYLNGNPAAPCSVRTGHSGSGLFTDATGISAWGFVSGDFVSISLNGPGQLEGRVGNTIYWSDGNYWTR